MQGLSTATLPSNLLAALIGALLGTIVGILPGLGPSTTVALLIPVTFSVSPESGLIMMTAVYCGAMYGGSLTSILLKVPGEASSVMTAIDGYELAKKGKAGPALAISAIGSFIGGTFSVILLMIIAIPLSKFALKFGPTEYMAIMLFALILSVTLIGNSIIKGVLSLALGIGVAVIGTDLQSGVTRNTLGIAHLTDGIDVIVAIIGVFGIGEVLHFLATRKQGQSDKRLSITGKLMPSKQDFKHTAAPIGRGSIIGFLSGLLPGSGSTLGSFIAYSVEKRFSKKPETFGKGALEGVASAETANNSATGGALVPLLTLGIPGSGTTAVLLGALMMYGIQPGPQLMTEQPVLVWAVIASLYISNIVLLILNLPMIRFFVKILDIPTRVLMPLILVFALIGAFSINNSINDIWLVLIFGLLGLFMRVVGLSPAIFILALVLGDQMEQSLRQSLIISKGSLIQFVTSPISLTLLIIAFGLLAYDVIKRFKSQSTGEYKSIE
ncbi:tripartite tricarboxylate transporter permease [Robertmurraya kyonggiensis]|nr:tripartite tricarboxylate transporter permease [Robertmurraya kyonggiensis]